ncbi:hypothetical protein AB0B89_24525 [Sphaerisporangium sp. NPDC049002]|uniref:hypothetical protein n=1 Tax=unclassified Sphaerisporangium TaxID=2630420 RepID=UPI00340183CE
MPEFRKLVGTLTIGAALAGGLVSLGAVTTTSSASAASTMTMSPMGDYRDYDRARNRNRSWNRTLARNWTRSWARNFARHWNRSHSHSANRQAQAINIRLIFPNQLGTPVTASATATTPTVTSTPRS